MARLNSTYDAVDEALMVVDDAGRIVAANHRTEQILSIPRSALWGDARDKNQGESFVSAVADRFQRSNRIQELWQESRDNPQLVHSCELETNETPPRTLIVYTAPIQPQQESDDSSRPEARIWTFTDVSERKKLQMDLIQSQKMEAVGRLAGGVAHDFNNLLLAINANLELTRLYTRTDIDKCDNCLANAERAVDRAAKLVKHLLSFSRKSNLEMRVRRLDDVINRTKSLLERILKSKIRLEIHHDSESWPVQMDETHIEQVLLNLCLNARDAVGDQEGTITISTSNVAELEIHDEAGSDEILESREWVKISIKDDGAGIPEEAHKHVFEPFFTTKEPGKGTGLGLSMSLGIVQQHGGTIQLASSSVKGSEFVIYLPRATAALDLIEESETGLFGNESQLSGSVLLADDDELVLSATADALRSLGYTVTPVASGLDALIHLRSTQSYDVVVMDIAMPGMSGLEVAKRMKEEGIECATILSSGNFDSVQQATGGDDQFAVISKPFRVGSLVKMIQTARGAIVRSDATHAKSPVRPPHLSQPSNRPQRSDDA